MKKVRVKITPPKAKRKLKKGGGYKQEKYNNYDETRRQIHTSNPLAFKKIDTEGLGMGTTTLQGENKKEFLSLTDEVVNTRYPEVDKKDANAEVEKNELIFTMNEELYKFNGKTHKRGGTHVALEDGDFIFSDSIKIKGDDLVALMPKIDEKSKHYKKGLSPAYLASKLLDYNKHKENQAADISFDRKTAELNISNYNKRLAEIAFIQEKQKDFEDGFPQRLAQYIPEIAGEFIDEDTELQDGYYMLGGMVRDSKYSRGGAKSGKDLMNTKVGSPSKETDPIYNLTKEDIRSTLLANDLITLVVEAAKNGGSIPENISNQANADFAADVLNRIQSGEDGNELLQFLQGTVPTKQEATTTPDGLKPWTGDIYSDKQNQSKYSKEQWDQFAKDLGFTGSNNTEFQQFLYNSPHFKAIIDEAHSDSGLGMPNAGTMFDGKLGARWDIIIDKINSLPTPTKKEAVKEIADNSPSKYNIDAGKVETNSYANTGLGYAPDDIGIAGALMQAFYPHTFTEPVRVQVSPRYVEAGLLDPQSNINDVTNATTRMGEQLSRTASAPQAAAMMSGLVGRNAEAISTIRQRYDNANTGIRNQVNAANADIYNRSAVINAQSAEGYNKDVANYYTAKDNTNLKGIQTATNAFAAGAFNDYMSNLAATSGYFQQYAMMPTGEVIHMPSVANITGQKPGQSQGLTFESFKNKSAEERQVMKDYAEVMKSMGLT